MNVGSTESECADIVTNMHRPSAVRSREGKNVWSEAPVLLNYLYAVPESEMTVAVLAVGLGPGVGMAHSDIVDAIEAARTHVDY